MSPPPLVLLLLLLQRLLDHDNLELRKRMKDFFQSDDIYIPRCGWRPACGTCRPAQLSCARNPAPAATQTHACPGCAEQPFCCADRAVR